jgi:hypothetical protein
MIVQQVPSYLSLLITKYYSMSYEEEDTWLHVSSSSYDMLCSRYHPVLSITL